MVDQPAAAPQPNQGKGRKKAAGAPGNDIAANHRIKGLSVQQKAMLNFVESEVVEDDE